MEKLNLLYELPGKQVYETETAIVHWVEFTGPDAAFLNTMHSFLMTGLSEMEVSSNFVGQVSETAYAAMKGLEVPMTLTVITGGDELSYAYYIDGKPATRADALDVVWEEALLNMEDTGRYVWDTLQGYFARFNIDLGPVDFRFSHVAEHFLVLTGDLTPETMTLLDPATGKRLWKGEDGVENAYEIIMQRMSA